jgi:hypothetical protein
MLWFDALAAEYLEHNALRMGKACTDCEKNLSSVVSSFDKPAMALGGVDDHDARVSGGFKR